MRHEAQDNRGKDIEASEHGELDALSQRHRQVAAGGLAGAGQDG